MFVVLQVCFQNALQRKFIEDDYVGQRSDETLRVRVRQCENTHMKDTRKRLNRSMWASTQTDFSW